MKKAQHRRMNTFKLGCCGRLLRVPWKERRSNQSIVKEINPEYSFIGKTNAKAEAPILWPPDVKSWLIGKDPDAGKDWKQKEKGAAEDEIVRWHHQLNWQEFEQTLGRTGKPGVLQSVGLQSVGHDLVTEQQHGKIKKKKNGTDESICRGWIEL